MSETRAPYGTGSADDFDPATADERRIRERARPLPGLRLSQVATMPARRIVSARETKGNVGAIYEAYFGMRPNSSPEPDFRAARIELKTVPLERRARDVAVKERTFVGMIDYGSLPTERWETAAVRKKLDHILFIYYLWARDTDIYDFVTDSCVFWRPDEALLDLCRKDWELVRRKVAEGCAHELGEGDCRVLRPATKGADGDRRVSQPFSVIGARPRAWSLKPSLTRSIRLEALHQVSMESLSENLGLSHPDAFEQAALSRFEPFVGLTVREAADRLGVPLSTGYHFKADVVRRALGAKNARARFKEFERLGIEIKTVRVSPRARPYEAMSFPAFRYQELIEEEWESSELAEDLRRLLVVPIVGPERATPAEDCVISTPFFWSPSSEEWSGIEREWRRFREEIRSGRATDLTPASETRYIHVRPHGQDGSDTDVAPIVGPVVKKSFWLNQPFVQELILRNSDRFGS